MEGKNLIILIIIGIFLVIGIGILAFIFLNSPEPVGKCGDGVCGSVEKQKGICPEDCEIQPNKIIPNYDNEIDYEDSPFGFHPARISLAGYDDNGYDDAQNIGVKWTREGLYAFWFMVQPDIEKDEYDFSTLDRQWKDIPQDLSIVANIVVAPQQLLKNDEKIEEREHAPKYMIEGSFLPTNEEKYIKFVKATIERYDGDGVDDMPDLKNPIKYWQVGNEPDGKTIKDFAALQKMTYDAIKDVCQDCTILIGGCTGMPPVEKYISNFDESYLPILNELASYSKSFDIFDIHWYGNATGDYKQVKKAYDHIQKKVKALGLNVDEYWVTEMGSYSGDPKKLVFMPIDIFSFQTESQQAGDYLKRYVYPLSIGIKKVFLAWGVIEGFKHNDGYFDHTGLIYDGEFSNDLGLGVKKLAYYTYKLMVEKLEGSDWDNVETIQESDNIYIYKFMKNNEPVWVAWNDDVNSKTISLDVGSISLVKITEAIPDAEDGSKIDEEDYPDFFKTETKTASNGKVEITLGESPVFVEAN